MRNILIKISRERELRWAQKRKRNFSDSNLFVWHWMAGGWRWNCGKHKK